MMSRVTDTTCFTAGGEFDPNLIDDVANAEDALDKISLEVLFLSWSGVIRGC